MIQKLYLLKLEGYAVKMPDQIEIKVLRELFALYDATGIVATCHVDGKIVNEKLIAKLKRNDKSNAQLREASS